METPGLRQAPARKGGHARTALREEQLRDRPSGGSTREERSRGAATTGAFQKVAAGAQSRQAVNAVGPVTQETHAECKVGPRQFVATGALSPATPAGADQAPTKCSTFAPAEPRHATS